MKITIQEYTTEWPEQFGRVKSELEDVLAGLHPVVEHIGSTSVPGLAAKPVIDIMVGLGSAADLDSTIEPMTARGYIYYEVFNAVMPGRRLFVGLKDKADRARFQQVYAEGDEIPHEELNLLRHTHVHIWERGTEEWIRHIAFREYLKAHPDVKAAYAALKKQLSRKSWQHGMEYNAAKDTFIKATEKEAVRWYRGGSAMR